MRYLHSNKELIERFLISSTLSISSRSVYEITINQLLKFHKDTSLLKIDYDDIVDFREYRLRSKVQRSTINKDLYRLSALFEWLLDRELISENPVTRVTKFKLKRSEKIKIRYVKHEDVLKLIERPLFPKLEKPNKWQIRDHAILATLYYSGIRTADLTNLHLIDVSLENSNISIRQSKGNLDRLVEIPDVLVNILKKYLSKWRISEGRLFRSKRGNSITPKAIQDIVSKYADEAHIVAIGDKKKITPVTLRHSYATYLTEQGVSPYTLGEQMGNSTVVERYAHVTKEAKRAAANKFEK